MSAAARTFKCSQSFAESAGDKSRHLNTEKQTHETASRANKRPGLDLSPGWRRPVHQCCYWNLPGEAKAMRQVRPAWAFSRSALTDAKGACLLFARSWHGRWRECQCHHRRGRQTTTNPPPVVGDAVPTSVFSLRRLIRVHQQRADAASDGLIDFSVRLGVLLQTLYGRLIGSLANEVDVAVAVAVAVTTTWLGHAVDHIPSKSELQQNRRSLLCFSPGFSLFSSRPSRWFISSSAVNLVSCQLTDCCCRSTCESQRP